MSGLDSKCMSRIFSFKANIDAVCNLVVFLGVGIWLGKSFIYFAVTYYFRRFPGDAYLFSDALANSGAYVLFCSGGGSGVYSLLAAFPRWQNHLHKYQRFPDDVLLSVL